MGLEQISPDHVEYFRWGFFSLNATLLYSWLVMALLVGVSWTVTRRLSTGPRMSPRQNLLEVVVSSMRSQIADMGVRDPDRYLPFVGTLFLFILLSNVLGVVPGFISPTASLSTTAALAICVFFAVPYYGIREIGFGNYIRNYLRPTPFMLPFNVIGEFSRTLALAVRLFGNVMSGTKIVGILLAVAPLVFPVLVHALGLLTGVIQAYIFALLAMVYIASAAQRESDRVSEIAPQSEGNANG